MPKPQPKSEKKRKEAGRLHKSFKRTKDAIALIEEILADTPNHAPTLLLRAEIHIDQGELEQALSAARRAQMADPELSESYYILGALLEATKDHANALRNYQLYLEYDPKGPRANVVKNSIRSLERTLGK